MTAENSRHLPPEALEGWLERICAELEITEKVDIAAVLDLTGEVAHGVARPAAPLTAFALGLALGRRPPEEYEAEFDRMAGRIADLAGREGAG